MTALVVPTWVLVTSGLACLLIGVCIGAALAVEDQAWRRRNRGGFTDPGMSRERLGLGDTIREGRSREGPIRRPRRIAPDALEDPPEFGS